MLLVAGSLLAGSAPAQVGGATDSSTSHHSILGINIGSVTVTASYICPPCNSYFIGSPVVSETMLLFSCELSSSQIVPVVCGPAERCPNGVEVGQQQTVVVKCCPELLISGAARMVGICFSSTHVLVACPA